MEQTGRGIGRSLPLHLDALSALLTANASALPVNLPVPRNRRAGMTFGLFWVLYRKWCVSICWPNPGLFCANDKVHLSRLVTKRSLLASAC